MTSSMATVSYIGATILFILSLGGLAHPETARRGNLFGMIGMALAVLATVFGPQVSLSGVPWIIVALLIGAGGYFGLPGPQGDVELGFSVIPERRCLGYGSEIAEALAKRAFLDPRVRRVIAHNAPDNTPSKKALEKSGFRFTGLLTGQGNLEYVYAPSNPS